jgi:hypothetical protein
MVISVVQVRARDGEGHGRFSDEMREVAESEWPELARKLPAKKKSRG